MIPLTVGYTYTANKELSAGFYIFVAIVAFVGALTIAGLLMWHRLPKCCFAQRQVCCKIDSFDYNHVICSAIFKAALYQNVEKTDVNQIYGEYYFSSDGERRDSVTEVDNMRNRYYLLKNSRSLIQSIFSLYTSAFKTLTDNRQQSRVHQHQRGE